MSARDFDELLSAYLDGEVTPEERAAVERRLEQSPALRETLDELSEVGDLIRRLPRARPPVDLPERVVAAIATKPLASTAAASTAAASHRRDPWRSWPMMTAGTVLAASIAFVMLLPEQQARAPRVATNQASPETELAAAGQAPDRKLTEDFDVLMGAAVRAENEAAPEGQLDGTSPQTESLSRYVRRLERKPRQGEVLSTLVSNAGQTQVLQYTVVDTREAAGTLNTIFANNSLDIVVTETPTPPASVAATADTMYWYLEGPPEQMGKTLQQIKTLSTGKVDELGPLSLDSEPSGTPLDSGAEPQRSNDLYFRVPSDAAALDVTSSAGVPAIAAPVASSVPAEDRSATSQSTPQPSSAPSQTPSASSASGFATDFIRPQRSALEDRIAPGKDAEAAGAEAPKFALPGGGVTAPAENPASAAAAPATPSTWSFNGLSAQLDAPSATPIVEKMLRNRASGNSSQRSLPLETRRNSLQRSTSNSLVEGGVRGQAKEAAPIELEPLAESKDPALLKQQKASDESVADGSVRLRNAPAANPRPVSDPAEPEQVTRFLIILQPELPQPASSLPAMKKAAN